MWDALALLPQRVQRGVRSDPLEAQLELLADLLDGVVVPEHFRDVVADRHPMLGARLTRDLPGSLVLVEHRNGRAL